MTQQVSLSDEIILGKIYLIRGQKVMLDRDLAELYEVDTKVLKLEIEEIKKKLSNQGKDIGLVFDYLDELIKKNENEKPR